VSIVSAVAIACLGGMVGGVVAGIVPEFLRRRRRGQGEPTAGYGQGADDGGIKALGRKVVDTKEAVERVQQDLNFLSEEVRKLPQRLAGAAPQSERPPHREAGAGRRVELERPSYVPGQRTDFPPPHGGYGAAATGGPAFGASGGELVLEREESSWDAAPPVTTPPANAVLVEARDDRIIATSSFPPEAWLKPGPGPAEGEVTLNPMVALNENALRRLSTFFEWQGERPGSAYETLRPAVVRWDSGQRIGTFQMRGAARPL
jgi:uncharacterized coiled-coil protein SlyX